MFDSAMDSMGFMVVLQLLGLWLLSFLPHTVMVTLSIIICHVIVLHWYYLLGPCIMSALSPWQLETQQSAFIFVQSFQ